MIASNRLQFTEDLEISRLLNGMWQVSGAHGKISPEKAIAGMFDYTEAGFTTWDLADHYGPAEDFIGEFRRRLADTKGVEALKNIQAFTKWVPRPTAMTRRIVTENIDISLKRMRVDSLDLLQFHWWDYRDKNYLTALSLLSDLQREGKIKHLALTNFDTERLKEIVGTGIKIVSNQVQFSIIDRRPLQAMIDYCRQQNIYLLAYGTLAGGLLSDKYLGKREPVFSDLDTASKRKYKNTIDIWGGWNLFQSLLTVVDSIARKYNVSIPNVATRYILEQPAVAGVIIGTRLGISSHITDNARVFDFQLSEEDYLELDRVLSRSRDLYRAIGDCGDEYRR